MFLFNKNKTYEKIDLKHKFLVQKIKKSDEKVVLILKDNKLKAKCTYYINNKLDTRINTVREGFTIKIDAKKSKLVNNTVLNNFNYKNYMKSKKIYNACIIKNFSIVSSKENIFYKIKNLVRMRINKSSNLDYMHIFILGDMSFLDEEALNKYRGNGLSHLFAISGMHINFFALFLLRFLKKTRLEEEKAYFLVVIVIWFYSFLTGFSGSVIRASIFFTILTINKVFMLEIKTINALFLTLFVVMIYNPNILYDISFLYSFLSTLGLVYGIKNGLFLSSVYAQVFTIPVSIANFHTVNFITIFINPLFSWLVSSIIYPLALLTFFIFKLGYILSFLTNILEGLSSFFYNISIFKVEFRNLSILFIIIYYGIVLLFINKGFKKCILLLTILLVFSNLTLNFDNNYYVDFIDVNQGDSTLIRHRKSVYIIDTGGVIGSFNSDFKVSDRTINYLKSLGINKIKALILTHGDYDHMGEAINLINNFKVEKVIFNCGPYNDLEKDLIKVVNKKKIKYYSCIKELNIDKNKLYFLQTKEYDNENDNSNVVYTELSGYKFMFMGDASSTTEKEIIDKYNLPDIDVLKVGHHGSKTSSGKEFIDEINPKYSIISVGKNNRYGHPNKEVLDNLKNSKIYRTDKDGSIMFKIKNNKLEIENCNP